MKLRLLLMSVLFLVSGCANVSAAGRPAFSEAPSPPPSPVVSKPAAAITYPAHGGGHWVEAPGQAGPAAGHAGTLLRYRILVERDIHGLAPAAFANTVTATLSDPRSWTAGGQWRLLRVGAGQPYDFTIYLATPDTRDPLCGDNPDGYTSCRNGDTVVLNVARWVKGVPNYGASLTTYRQYMVNHEVGHRLYQGHELCPGKGRPAPVMQQQTLGLHGCTANPWPYLGGKRYAGASGVYDDRLPGRDEGRS